MTSGPVRILVIDDDAVAREAVRRALAHSHLDHRIDEAELGVEGLALYEKGRHDIVLLDYRLPDRDADTVLAELLGDRECPPAVVVVSNKASEELALALLERGALDYVPKDEVRPSTLSRAIRYALARRSFLHSEHELQQALERAHKRELELRDEFLSNVSHELRTPLSVIHQFLSILVRGMAGTLEPEQHDYVETALRNATDLTRMIDDLMEVTRATTQKLRVEPRPTLLHELLTQTAEDFGEAAAGSQVEIEVATGADETAQVLADPQRVRQVLRNLVENALKFTPPQGRIRLEMGPAAEADLLEVAVSDTGCGITPEGCSRVFERMHQEEKQGDGEASRRGLGLGLYLCRELLERQGGRIRVESELGRGSSFRFTLPAFRMENVIRRAVIDGEVLRPAFGLVRVDLSANSSTSQGAIRLLARKVTHLIRSTMFEDLDVLLPPGVGDASGTSYQVLAGTDRQGLASLAWRIRREIERDAGTTPPGVELSVRFREEELPRADGLEQALAGVVQRLSAVSGDESNWEEA